MINRKDSKTMDLNLENAIPIKVLEDELLGLRAEYQCDMGGMYAMQKIKAIENVLDWFGTPDYKRRLGHSGFKKESKPTKIEDMNLSVRSYNCLKIAGIDTLQQLAKLSYEELIHVRNLGSKSTGEIIKKLKEYGYEIIKTGVQNNAEYNLKPCPFCGGEADIHKGEQIFSTGNMKYYTAYCKDCFCSLIYEKTEQEAVDSWNSRVDND